MHIRDDKYRFATTAHQNWLSKDAKRQFDFFKGSLRRGAGFFVLDCNGRPLQGEVQELHTTTRLVYSFSLGKNAGLTGCEEIIDQGMSYLLENHRDVDHGGYFWAIDAHEVHDSVKLAYGHVFVLLAGAAAKMSGHPDADRLIGDASDVLDKYFWDENAGLFKDEYSGDWTTLSPYRGMNANMHGVEALLTAFEATGQKPFLDRAGRILDFFVDKIAVQNKWRLAEHFDENWNIDWTYSGNPMFRPAGTTPGHSFEIARLLLQEWDLGGRQREDAQAKAWALVERALLDSWDKEQGGFFYTLSADGSPKIKNRYWWPLAEAIGVLSSFMKLGGTQEQALWYSRLWAFADKHFMDHKFGGWFPELDDNGQPTASQFHGKPDIYHSIQATLLPLSSRISRVHQGEKPVF